MQKGSLFRSFIIIGGIIFFSINSYAQTFEEWKQQQEQEFQEYKDKFDAEFINMLKSTWEEVEVTTELKFYEQKKPVEVPIFVPLSPPLPNLQNQAPKDEIIEEHINIELDLNFDAIPIDVSRASKPQEPTATIFDLLPVQNYSLNYFSNDIPFMYPTLVKSKLALTNYRNGLIDNKKIADFWEVVSSIDHTNFLNYTTDLRIQMELNDWGFILLINEISKQIFGEQNRNLVRMMNWFLLTKAGYQNKVGYDQNGVYNLFTVSNNIFNAKYYTLDGNKFFPINFNHEYQTPSSIFTYQGIHQAQVKKLDLTIHQYPRFSNSNANMYTKYLEFEYLNEIYSIPIKVNKDVIAYFEYYPLTDLPIFFNASLSSTTFAQITSALKPILETMTELEAVNFLLRLVQTSFDYKTDQDQFDREKYMTPDEIFYYQYSDCDDRSIFFATLVRDILGLEVVGVRYSRHIAVAVHFTNTVDGDYYLSDGKKFIVADPTFINAPVGRTMTSYVNEKPVIIKF